MKRQLKEEKDAFDTLIGILLTYDISLVVCARRETANKKVEFKKWFEFTTMHIALMKREREILLQ